MATVVGFDSNIVPKFQKTCRSCGAIVKYFKNDIREYHGKDIGGGPDGQTWIVCPNCGDDIILSSW